MKKLLLSLTLLVGVAVHVAAEPTAKAIYCAANTTLYFTYDEVTYNTSTAYEQLDGNTPTKVYNNIPITSYPGNSAGSTRILSNGKLDVYDYVITTPWCKDYSTVITAVKIKENFKDWKPQSLEFFFFFLEKLVSFEGGEYLNTSEVTSMNEMFCYCYSLPNLDFLSEWDTSNVKFLKETFNACYDLTNIDGLEEWKVSNVLSLDNFMGHCINLTNFDKLYKWDVSNVENMGGTFIGCSKLSNIDGLANWDVKNVLEFGRTFESTAITNVDALSLWDTSNAKDFVSTFYDCKQLANIEGLSQWKSSGVVRMTSMFESTAITNVDALSEWDTGKVNSFASIFRNCSSLINIEGLENWDVANVKTLASAFRDVLKIKQLIIRHL